MQSRTLLLLVIVISSAGFVFLIFFSEQKYDVSKQITNECNLDIDCGIGILLEISRTHDENSVLNSFHELKSYYQKNLPLCHKYTHHLGEFLYYYYEDYEKALSIADSTCGGAMYHGVVESHFVKFENPDIVNIAEMCKKFPRQLDRENLECVHGMGHALFSVYDDVFIAIDRCGDFTSIFEMDRCSSGVFMENIQKQSRLNFVDFKENEIHYPCNSVSEEFVRGCYQQQAFYIIHQNNNSATQSFGVCDVLTREEKNYCYQGLGLYISGNNLDDIKRIKELCELGDKEYQPQCILGAALDLADDKNIDQGFEFCKISQDYSKEACYDALGKWTKMLYDSEIEIEKQCSEAENSKYFNVCLDASLDSMF